jgi:hypothetical protein
MGTAALRSLNLTANGYGAESSQRPYGNVVLKKGVVGPDGKDLMP